MYQKIIFKHLLMLPYILFVYSCGPDLTDPDTGDRCEPKWWGSAGSSSEVVYGYGREASRDSGTARALSLSEAQRDALTQINTFIDAEIIKAVEEYEAMEGIDVAEEYIKAVGNDLKVNTDAPCNYCGRDDSAECTESGKLVVFTKVRVNVEDYLNEDLQVKIQSLLEKPRATLDRVRNK